MHILYLYQYFCTPKYASAIRAYKFAELWLAQGHKVTVLTSTAEINEEYLHDAKGSFFKRMTIDGINVIACSIPYNQHMGTLKRMLSFLLFALVSTYYALFFIKNYDIVYATSTPLTIGIPAILIKNICKKKFVFEVRDQWPEIPIEMGILTNKFIIKATLWLEKKIYMESAAIVALSPGMIAGVKTVLGCEVQKPLFSIPNCADLDMFNPELADLSIRQQYNWQDKLVFLYAGSLGEVNRIDLLVEAAKRLRDIEDLLFVIIGFGSMEKLIQEQVNKFHLTNVQLLGPKPKSQLPIFLNACDISLSLIAPVPILEHNSANKFFDALAAGKPILLNHSGWQRTIIEKHNAGWGCRQGDLDEYVEKIMFIFNNRNKLNEIGKNARKLAEEQFDRKKLALQALEVIQDTYQKNQR